LAKTKVVGLISLDAPAQQNHQSKVGDEYQMTLGETLLSTEKGAEEKMELTMLRQSLENAMAAELSPYERDVMRLKLGLDDGRSRTESEVVDICGGCISVSDVRMAENRAIRKLRSRHHAHNLVSFVVEDKMGKYTPKYHE